MGEAFHAKVSVAPYGIGGGGSASNGGSGPSGSQSWSPLVQMRLSRQRAQLAALHLVVRTDGPVTVGKHVKPRHLPDRVSGFRDAAVAGGRSLARRRRRAPTVRRSSAPGLAVATVGARKVDAARGVAKADPPVSGAFTAGGGSPTAPSRERMARARLGVLRAGLGYPLRPPPSAAASAAATFRSLR